MATTFVSIANTFLSTSSSSSLNPQKQNVNGRCKKTAAICCSSSSSSVPTQVVLSKRGICIAFILSSVTTAAGGWSKANAAILEADEDDELMDKIKKDGKKRIDNQALILSSKKEIGYLQEVVNKLSKVEQAIDNTDLVGANSLVGAKQDKDWIKKANLAFAKFSSNPEEKDEVQAFNSSVSTLISAVVYVRTYAILFAVSGNDLEASKLALVSSAKALEKWTALTGLGSQLKGL